MKQFGIHFSAYHPKISDQLKEQGIKFILESDERKFQRLADHCTNLRLSGVLTDTEAGKVHKRILKQLTKAVTEI